MQNRPVILQHDNDENIRLLLFIKLSEQKINGSNGFVIYYILKVQIGRRR